MTMLQPPSPPTSEEELIARARQLAGLSLSQVAEKYGVALPTDLRRHKGWSGQLIELALGASAASLPEPDFQQIGVELKTIPVDRQGRPMESTYVCTVPIEEEAMQQRWENCWVKQKLARVLWIPVEGNSEIPLSDRRLGNPLLWSPSAKQESQLRNDWEELMEMICMGQVQKITARFGDVLQIRPKAASSSVRGRAIGEEGQHIRTNPRGFYLRSRFTATLLAHYFALDR